MVCVRRICRAAAVLLLSLVMSVHAYANETVLVAAASDLKFALDEIVSVFQSRTGKSVKVAYGSSGNFRRQIAEGAPFDLFMSADEAFVFDLQKENRTLDEGALYAIGRLVIMVPHGSTLDADPQMKDLAAALRDGRVKKFAIANPEHAPYGRAAKEAMQKAGVWEALRDKLVLGENVSQAAQFATSGSAQGGIIALSLAVAPAVLKRGKYALIPADWHAPLRQRMVLLKRAGPAAKAFYAFMQQPEARAILVRYGFLLPGDQ